MSDLCVQDHGEDERRALPGLRLCGGHRDGLERDLGALPRLHSDLATILATGGAASGSGRVSGTSSAPLPIRPDVAAHRDQIRHDLVWWAVFVADERGHALPKDDVLDIARWLGRHVDWIAANLPAAEECPPVMRGLAGRARSLLDPNRRLPTGERCRKVPDGGERCPGVVSMIQKPDETWTARCTVCGPQEAAPYLHDRVNGRWVTIERLEAYALGRHGARVPRATIRSWAVRDQISTRTEDGHTWYELGSVEARLRDWAERERARQAKAVARAGNGDYELSPRA
ncbi:hypothetical protein [Actinomadura litoris]|uniref:hypothetical protein n=1 Tax=Actinomadura litoris TaxID=2678616 RepID=UPI001FA7631A|nr:hypothetical protein [Actinomadura litoris]